jgi:DNA-binding NarL/FixJ family response regulator
MQTEVIICDQQAVYAIGSAMIAQRHSAFTSTQIFDDLNKVKEALSADLPRVLVIDSSMFDFSHNEYIDQIIKLKKQAPIMIVLNEEDALILFQLIDNGFSVIVSRNASTEEWLKGLEMAQLRKVYFSKEIAYKVHALSNNMDELQLIDRVNQLALYDKYILIRICQEAPSKLIASELGNSKRTIEGHRTKMMQMFDVKNVAGLVKIACTTRLYHNYLSNPGLYDVTLCAKTSSL